MTEISLPATRNAGIVAGANIDDRNVKRVPWLCTCTTE